jgi:alpha-L-fucosidase
MRPLFFLALLSILSGVQLSAQPIQPSNQPNPTQQLLIERGYGMFIHFGINTFADVEWSDGSLAPAVYAPTSLDCDQWVRVARDAGFRYVLLTTKHHDGFCLWDSRYTDYDVASSPVKTDVLAAVAEACRKYGLKFAVYYSLWDRHETCYKDPDPRKYVRFMENQLTELLTKYGEVSELWLDGGWDRKPQDWGLDSVYALVKRLQPHCAMGVNHTIVYEEGKRRYVTPDDMTSDNRYYFQYFPSDFRLWDPKIAHLSDKKQYLHEGKSYYMPFEHTICISKAWNWFQKSQPQPMRSLDELEELFYWCTANQNTLVVDIPPGANGRIPEPEANTAIALARRLNLRPGKPLPVNGRFISLQKPALASSTDSSQKPLPEARFAVDGGMQTRWAAKDTLCELTIALNPDEPFNKISIFEYQDVEESDDGFSNTRTNRIQSYSIDIRKDNRWLTIYRDDTSMGDCKVIRFPEPYQTSEIRINVLKASAPPSIYEICVIDMNQRPAGEP